MKRFINGLTYGFKRNLGKKDRLIRAIISVMVLTTWAFGWLTGIAGLVLGILALMVLATAFAARCGINYWLNINTMSSAEKKSLDLKSIDYE